MPVFLRCLIKKELDSPAPASHHESIDLALTSTVKLQLPLEMYGKVYSWALAPSFLRELKLFVMELTKYLLV